MANLSQSSPTTSQLPMPPCSQGSSQCHRGRAAHSSLKCDSSPATALGTSANNGFVPRRFDLCSPTEAGFSATPISAFMGRDFASFLKPFWRNGRLSVPILAASLRID